MTSMWKRTARVSRPAAPLTRRCPLKILSRFPYRADLR